MINCLIFLATFCCCLNVWETHTITIIPKSVEDYYWRDFEALVPSGAIVGGSDDSGKSTYIGQFTVDAEYGREKSVFHTVPAIVRSGVTVATAAYNGRTISSNVTSNLKVLCGTTARYKWFAKTAEFPVNCRFVIAGYEDTSPMYVGRTTQGREVVTGKVFADITQHRSGLIIPYQGAELYPESYEILTYCY